MDAVRTINAARRIFTRLGLAAAVLWALCLAAGNSPARAGVLESVKRALPATVAVEWHDAPGKTTAARAATAGGTSSQSSTGGTSSSAAPDQLRMASGTLVSADGLIVTMIGSHGGGQYTATLADGRTLPARLFVDDRRSRLQLLKVDAAGLPFLSISNQPPQIGEEVTWTYCLDHNQRAAARGIIAATGRELKGLGDDLLQLDMGVGIMSAGAPLVDEPGRLVGIIAYSRVGQSQRTGFAIPAAAVEALLAARKGDATAVVLHGMLGVYLTPHDKDNGRVIAHPANDSPAAAAGVRDGDEILAVDGLKVDSLKRLGRLIGSRSAGQKVSLTIRRDGNEQAIDVTLAAAPGQTEVPATPEGIGPPASSSSSGSSGSGSSGGSSGSSGSGGASKPTLSVIKPESIYVMDADGRLHALSGQLPEKSLESLREYYKSAYKLGITTSGAANEPQVAVPSLRVERSDLQKTLEEISRDVQSLRQQMEKLTEELQRMQKSSTGTTQK